MPITRSIDSILAYLSRSDITRHGSYLRLSVTDIKKPIKFCGLLCLGTVSMVGCQSQPVNSTTTTSPVITTTSDPAKVSETTILFLPSRLPAFNIQGKIGVIIPETDQQTRSSASAFYVWAQEDDRFAIDLTGAMGLGHTVIEYDGQTASLTSERTGTITADSPDGLLAQATGWQAPISQLPYWISGSPTPSDIDTVVDEYQRIASSVNGNWTATFNYLDSDSTLPDKIKMLRDDGHRVTMTITHNIPIPSSTSDTSFHESQLHNTVESNPIDAISSTSHSSSNIAPNNIVSAP